MVVATAAAVAVVVPGGAGAMAGAAAGLTSGGAATAGAVTGTVKTGTAIAAAVGTGASSGAIAGASASGCYFGAGAGALAGATSAAASSSAGIAAGTMWATVCTGGLGLMVVGTSNNTKKDRITYDCWKKVIHDTSMEPSNGMLLKDVVCHPYIAKVTMTPGAWPELPNIVLENIWNETFEIEYLLLHDTGKILGHAKHICL